MIVVDSSVWIAHFANVLHPEVRLLRDLEEVESILVGDVVLLEVLKGAPAGGGAQLIDARLSKFQQASMLGTETARKAAANYRLLRAKGITIRNSVDLIIGTFCVEHGHQLLHRDRDFDHFERHLGLRVLR